MSRQKVLSAIIKKYDQLSMPENCVSQKGSLEGCLILILVYCFFFAKLLGGLIVPTLCQTTIVSICLSFLTFPNSLRTMILGDLEDLEGPHNKG